VPLPRALGRFNVRVTNRLLWPIVQFLPSFGRVVHVGRRSGRVYRTPVNLFRRGEYAVLAMTYGTQTDWLRNVLTAGRFAFESRGGTLRLVQPQVIHDPSQRLVPWLVRIPLRLTGVADFLVVRVEAEVPRARPLGLT
jgi:deazaflavin-dependent oxidoreductase (nitroreductase family)